MNIIQSKKVNKHLAIHGIGYEERAENDYYSTPPQITEYLLEREEFNHNVLEPCVGGGAIARLLEQKGYDVTGIDIVDRGYPGTIVEDFLKHQQMFDGDIITNPPYNIQLDFVKQCLKIGNKVALLLKLQFLETIQRYKELHSINPPNRVYIFVKRVNCYKNDEPKNLHSSFCFCWYVWDKNEKDTNTYLYWIPNHKKR